MVRVFRDLGVGEVDDHFSLDFMARKKISFR